VIDLHAFRVEKVTFKFLIHCATHLRFTEGVETCFTLMMAVHFS